MHRDLSRLVSCRGKSQQTETHSGDAAFYDENGYVYVLDRIKDIIKYKGTMVSWTL